jgi:hypothetical protein
VTNCSGQPCQTLCVFTCLPGDTRCQGPNGTTDGQCDKDGSCTPPWSFPPRCF